MFLGFALEKPEVQQLAARLDSESKYFQDFMDGEAALSKNCIFLPSLAAPDCKRFAWKRSDANSLVSWLFEFASFQLYILLSTSLNCSLQKQNRH